MNATATIGDNSRNATPLELIGGRIADLCETAGHYCDGTPIADEEQASDVAHTIAELRRASSEADKARETEKAPHLAAGKAVDATWKPLIDRAERAKTAALAAQTAWLRTQEAAQARAATIAANAARALADAAKAARAAASPADLSAVEAAEAATQAADKARFEAKRIADAPVTAKGYDGARAIGLRTVWRAELTDRRAALNHYAATRPDELTAWIQQQADRDARGTRAPVPGVTFVAEQVAR